VKSSVSMTAIGFGGSGSFTKMYKRENRRSGFLEMIGRKGFSSLWSMVSSVVAFENIKSFCSTFCFLYLYLLAIRGFFLLRREYPDGPPLFLLYALESFPIFFRVFLLHATAHFVIFHPFFLFHSHNGFQYFLQSFYYIQLDFSTLFARFEKMQG
jgi:hypothetical protein